MRLARCAAAIAGLIMVVLLSGAPAALAGGGGPSPASVFPNPSTPGTSTTFTIDCSTAADTPCTSATLDGSPPGLPAQIPMQPGSQTDMFVATVVLPSSLAPGTYSPEITCSNGVAATPTLTVNAVPGKAPQTGDGTTSTATNTALANVGYGLLGAGALAGCVMLRRRWSGRTSSGPTGNRGATMPKLVNGVIVALVAAGLVLAFVGSHTLRWSPPAAPPKWEASRSRAPQNPPPARQAPARGHASVPTVRVAGNRYQETPMAHSVPVSVWIPHIKVRAEIISLGLTSGGVVRVTSLNTPVLNRWYHTSA